jgi:hypothetical protein
MTGNQCVESIFSLQQKVTKAIGPFLTIRPLSEAIDVKIDDDFKNKHFKELAKEHWPNKWPKNAYGWLLKMLGFHPDFGGARATDLSETIHTHS